VPRRLALRLALLAAAFLAIPLTVFFRGVVARRCLALKMASSPAVAAAPDCFLSFRRISLLFFACSALVCLGIYFPFFFLRGFG
jgi:hypothetical protein